MIAENIIFLGACLCFLSAAGQLVLKMKKRENYNLFLLFTLLGIILLQFHSMATSAVIAHPEYIAFHPTVLFIFCPILYYAYYIVSFPDAGVPKMYALYFIPALISAAADTYLFVFRNSPSGDLGRMFLGGENPADVILFKTFAVAAIGQILIYHFRLIKILVPSLKGNGGKNIIFITITISFLSATSSATVIPGYILGDENYIRFSALFIAVCVIITYLTGVRYPGFLQMLSLKVKRGIYSRSLLKGLDVDRLMLELEKLMTEKNIYRDETINLADTAISLGITHHQLSQLLNERLSMNFNTYINSYRIEEAKKLLIANPDRTVLTIAYEVGFNSKSSFYESFTKITGITPVEYRKTYHFIIR
ncbi:MAG TPA: helix-turn-helix domain-containing protein [Spirochaetota bacterium]|nr:helix-turn-helix domain-containing protein [Spirochaetota bacterium]